MAPATSKLSSHPIYNATFTLFRVSPLHLPSSSPPLSDKASLQACARRFADVLNGDVLRGVHVNTGGQLSGDGLTNAGAFRSCTWTWLGRRNDRVAAEEDEEPDSRSDGADGLGVTEGVQITVEYERNSYIALLLRGRRLAEGAGDVEQQQRDDSREVLPLLLVRMPAPLREPFLHFVSTTFDARTEPMLLHSVAIGEALEAHLGACASNGDDVQDKNACMEIVRDMQLSLSFKSPIQPSLRSLDISIDREDVPAFLREGRLLLASKEDPASSRSGIEKQEGRYRGPFMVMFAKYLEDSLALDLQHVDISLSRVACGAFALGKEGKAKIFSAGLSRSSTMPGSDDDEVENSITTASQKAVKVLITKLLEQAQNRLLAAQMDST